MDQRAKIEVGLTAAALVFICGYYVYTDRKQRAMWQKTRDALEEAAIVSVAQAGAVVADEQPTEPEGPMSAASILADAAELGTPDELLAAHSRRNGRKVAEPVEVV